MRVPMEGCKPVLCCDSGCDPEQEHAPTLRCIERNDVLDSVPFRIYK
jgi:hypothetical protein